MPFFKKNKTFVVLGPERVLPPLENFKDQRLVKKLTLFDRWPNQPSIEKVFLQLESLREYSHYFFKIQVYNSNSSQTFNVFCECGSCAFRVCVVRLCRSCGWSVCVVLVWCVWLAVCVWCLCGVRVCGLCGWCVLSLCVKFNKFKGKFPIKFH